MKSDLVSDGEFAGWRCWREDPFEQAAGPFYYRVDELGPVAAFRAGAKHMNLGASVHGGCLMSFADFALFAIAADDIGEDGFAVTAAFTSEFLAGAKEGQLVEARGEVLRSGKSLIFLRGLVTAEGTLCLNFSATLKRITLR